ncbi:50S ribosomal protein L16 [Candidatus Woesearchaeota archaeon]|nr:50S ribosomal protein L16 [Candidatus Woesearchaeota archaeon]
MATLRKGKCYRNIERAYTRKSKYKKKGYIRAVPNHKIVKFDLGNLTKDFEGVASLYTKDRLQIRHNALESARVVINRQLHKNLGASGYHLKLRVYPHHILRENKMLTGAGADRMQSGMQHSFGKAISTAAQLKEGQKIFSVYVDKKDINVAKEALKRAVARLPCKCGIEAI